MRVASFALVCGLAVGAASTASAACQFQKIADVPVTMVGLRPTILAKVDGQEGRFLVDTGAFFSGVTPESAAAFGMKHTVAPYGMRVMGVGGQLGAARRAIAAAGVWMDEKLGA